MSCCLLSLLDTARRDFTAHADCKHETCKSLISVSCARRGSVRSTDVTAPICSVEVLLLTCNLCNRCYFGGKKRVADWS